MSSSSTLQIPTLKMFYRFLDLLLHPIMFIFNGLNVDSVQETHPGHTFNVDPKDIDFKLSVKVNGSSKAKNYRTHRFDPRFHIPIIGGWKEYVVLGPSVINHNNWHIGWHVSKEGKFVYSELNIKPINDYGIKVLKGPMDFDVKFFAFNEKGSQIELKYFDEGIGGDRKYPKLRLF